MRVSLFLVCLFIASPAMAVEKVNGSPVVKDRVQLEHLSIGTWDDKNAAQDGLSRHRWQVSKGLTDRIDLAAAITVTDHPAQDLRASGLGVRGKYELTEQGDWWLGSAVQARYTHRVDTAPDDLHVRFIGQRTQGKFVATANLGLRREFGEHRRESVEIRTAAQALYRTSTEISPGVEFFKVFGRVNALGNEDERSMQLGPIVTGQFPVGDQGDALAYLAGYYWGLSDSSADEGARLQLNYTMDF